MMAKMRNENPEMFANMADSVQEVRSEMFVHVTALAAMPVQLARLKQAWKIAVSASDAGAAPTRRSEA